MRKSGNNGWPYKAPSSDISEYGEKVVLKCKSQILDQVTRQIPLPNLG